MQFALHHFPQPLPDETVYSLCSRYDHTSGNPSVRESLRDLFGIHMPITNSSLPGYLPLLWERLPPSVFRDPRQLLDAHTAFAYFRPFLQEKQANQAACRLTTGEKGAVKMLLGLVASRVGAGDPLRFCRSCMYSDTSAHGTAYWHRSHQLPGVLMCADHCEPLGEVQPALGEPRRHGLSLPPLQHPTPSIRPTRGMSEGALRRLRTLAGLSQKLLHGNLAPVPWPRLQETYKARLRDLELATETGSVRQRTVLAEFIGHYTSLARLTPFAALLRVENPETHWLRTLTRSRSRAIHPLKHLLFIGFLFPTWDEFLFALGTDSTPPQIPSRGAKDTPSPGQVDSLRSLVEKEGYSLTRAARVLGCSVSTLSVAAARNSVLLGQRRPKRIAESTEKQILKSLARGCSTAEVCALFRVSQSHVNRLLRAAPRVRYQNQRSRFRKERRLRRKRLAQTIADSPEATRKEIRRQVPAVYTWLYRHDREWLDAALPSSSVGQGYIGPRVDWAQRDRELAEAVRVAARDILDIGDHPLRLTVSSIGRHLRAKALFERCSDRLPRTAAALAEVIESLDDFRTRRAQWAANSLRRKGIFPNAWRIRREAGLPKHLSPTVERIVRELSGQESFDV